MHNSLFVPVLLGQDISLKAIRKKLEIPFLSGVYLTKPLKRCIQGSISVHLFLQQEMMTKNQGRIIQGQSKIERQTRNPNSLESLS